MKSDLNDRRVCVSFSVSCLILMNAYPSMSGYVPLNDIDEIYGRRDFFLPENQYVEIIPKKRQSFGRKHHWDAFFGRRR
jgi:hypothetical protein